MGISALLTTFGLYRVWGHPARTGSRICWSVIALVPLIGPIVIFAVHESDRAKTGTGNVFSSGISSDLTPRARAAGGFARKEADRLNHNFVGTEHLLLGLIRLGQGTAVHVLQKLGVDLGYLRTEIEKLVGFAPSQKIVGTAPFTPRVKKVFTLAAKEAKAMRHTYMGTEHILIGLLREGDGVAARILSNLGINIDRTREEILKELDPNSEVNHAPAAVPTVPRLSEVDAEPADPVIDSEYLANLAPRASQVRQLAREEAGQLNQTSIGTQHLLLGLIKLNQGIAARTLERMEISLETLRSKMRESVSVQPDETRAICSTPEITKVIALAAKEAKSLNHTYIGTEHILLGLLCEANGAAAHLLQHCNVDLKRTRQEILKELDPNA